MPSTRHDAEIEVSPEAVMAVILDFASYPKFLPEIEQCEIVRAADDEWDVKFTVKVVKRLRYTLRLQRTSETQVRWHMVDGVFKSNDGGWDLVPLNDGARTHVSYFIDLQVGMFVPSSIMRSLVERSLPETVERFKAEAEARVTN